MAAKKPGKRAKVGVCKQGAADRHTLFVEAFIANSGNATDAAIQAGYSPKSARYQGSKLLSDPHVSQQIAIRSKDLAKKYALTTDDVIRSISQELHFDPAKIYNEDGSLKSVLEMDEDVRMALTAIETEQHGSPDAPVFVRKYKWATKHQAREQAMKHLGMFEADNIQKGPMAELPRELIRAIVDRLKVLNGRNR